MFNMDCDWMFAPENALPSVEEKPYVDKYRYNMLNMDFDWMSPFSTPEDEDEMPDEDESEPISGESGWSFSLADNEVEPRHE